MNAVRCDMRSIPIDIRHLAALAATIGLLAAVPVVSAAEPFAASRQAVQLDRQIDWSRAALIVVQEGGRYKTLEAFAREALTALYGREKLPELSPLASLLEWTCNSAAYADTPVIRIRDRGLRFHFTEHMTEAARQRIRQTGYMTPREFSDPTVQRRIEELEPRFDTARAIGRVREAEETARFLDQLLRLVPRPGAPADALWYTPRELRTNAALALPESERPKLEELAQRFGAPAEGVTPEQAVQVLSPWNEIQKGWQHGDAARVQTGLDRLAAVLPTLAASGVYPSEPQRRAEARYYEDFVTGSVFSRASWGWLLYLLGTLISVAALVTGWRTPRVLGLVLLVAALSWHAYGLGLRWYIVGRVPVANMFEAITASAWLGIALALVVELVYRTRVFLLAAHVTGFFALVIAGYVLPGGGTVTTIMGILDDIMLRIHTVLIIASYALIFLAAVIATVYLCGYYLYRLIGATSPAVPALALAGAGVGSAGRWQRPVLAGGAPGDEARGPRLPAWLHQTDWSHLIILNMAFIMLFVGIILGAVWADYSWGRPWGWDPKETFAMNTWLIYAVLIHARFIVRRKGLWTAWLSIAGCAMMAFNWFVVNFYIVGLHSYA